MDDFTRRMLDSSSNPKATPPALPPLEADGNESSFHHKAATYAVLAIPACIFLNIVLGSVARATAGSITPATRLILSTLPGFVMLSAFPAGIIALCGIPKHGRKKLLWKGLLGVILPILLIALAIPAFMHVKKMSEEKVRQRQESR